jgi:hypothetical protein
VSYKDELDFLIAKAAERKLTIVTHRPPTAPDGFPGWLDDTYYEAQRVGKRIFLAHSLMELERALSWFKPGGASTTGRGRR